MPTICPTCKNEVPDGFNVCLFCGSPVTPSAPTQPQPQPQPQEQVQPNYQSDAQNFATTVAGQDQPSNAGFIPQPQPYYAQQGYPPQQPQGYAQQPVGYGYPPQGNPYGQMPPAYPQEEKASVGLAILSWFIPIAGWIIYFTQKDKKPKTAKRCGKVGLISFIVSFVLIFLVSFLIIGGTFALLGDAENWDVDWDTGGYSEEGDYDWGADWGDGWNVEVGDGVTIGGVEENENVDSNFGVDAPALDNQDTETSNPPVAETSTNWKDYTVYYKGTKMQLPVTVEEFASITGYNFSTASDASKTLKADQYEAASFRKGDSYITVGFYNNTGDTINYSKANVYYLSVNRSCDDASSWVFAGGLYPGMTMDKEKAQEILGPCDDMYVGDNTNTYTYYSLKYKDPESHILSASFEVTIVNGEIEGIETWKQYRTR